MNRYDIQRVLYLYARHQSIEDISDLCSIEPVIVKHVLVDNGITINKKQARVMTLSQEGYSYLKISNLLQISLEEVYNYIPSRKYKL